MGKYLQYGAGMVAPDDWINYDVSPSILVQKIPLLGKYIQNKRGVSLPKNIFYGDIIKGFPQHKESCDAVFCSHVLEHLSHDEFLIALRNTYSLLVPSGGGAGGVFRLIMPDLRAMCESYIASDDLQNRAYTFMVQTTLGVEYVRTGAIKRIRDALGNCRHCWLWDYDSVEPLLYQVGFKTVRPCSYNDSSIEAFKSVERLSKANGRFENAFAVEAIR